MTSAAVLVCFRAAQARPSTDRMQKPVLFLLLGIALLGAGALVIPGMFADDEAPVRRWSQAEEEDLPGNADADLADAAAPGMADRVAVEGAGSGAAGDRDEARIEVLLRGRIVDKWNAPVPAATVWLDFARGGQRGGPANRQRRVPEPVQTDREGRFAFQGQAFRSLRVSLQVAHQRHAPGLFDKDLGEVTAEVDLGDLALMQGGALLGRVTDLEGNGIPGATLRLNPENGNRMRMLRNRDNLLPAITADTNGYFRGVHLPAGDWTVGATARMHTEGRSATFAVEEEQQVEIDDIRLGPGYEVTGYVRDSQGQPIAKAEVTLRSQGWLNNQGNQGGQGNQPGNQGGQRGGRGQGGFGGFGGRDYSTTTDDAGRFFLEHLPGTMMRLDSRADGYLDYRQEGIEITLGRPLQVTMQDGLRITGLALDDVDGQPITRFAVRAMRVRGLDVPNPAEIDFAALMTQMRDPNLDDATRQQLRTQMESARASFGDRGRRGPDGPGNDRQEERGGFAGGFQRDLGKPERHANGEFVLTGLQEGVYEVHLQGTEHARYRSAEVEVRLGAPAPGVTARLDRGVFVAGLVLSERGEPVRGARVELRTASPNDNRGRRGRGGENGGNAEAWANMGRDFLRQAMGATLVLEAQTDATGEFIIKHVPRGGFRLQATADGFATATGEPFELTADRSDFELRLGLLGSIAGKVRGLASKETGEARVAAVPIDPNGMGRGGRGMMGGMFGGGGGGGGPFQNVNVASDGSYQIDNLAPGNYLVRSWIGSPQELMRELGPQFFAGTLTPDVAVRGGETSKWDVAVTRPLVGEVAGSVLHNGRPGAGYQIELTRVQEEGNDNNGMRGMMGGGRGGPMAMMGGGRSFQAAVASSGRFTIKDVPVGNYRLRVQAGRRGGMLHEEQVQVIAGSVVERSITLATASLKGTVTAVDGDAAALAGAVTLLPDMTELPEGWNAFRRDGTPTVEARLQRGSFQFDALKPGNYLLVLSVRGRERTTMPIVVAPGDGQTISVAAGKVAENTGGPGAGGPGNGARGQGAGGQGGRQQGNGGAPANGNRRGG